MRSDSTNTVQFPGQKISVVTGKLTAPDTDPSETYRVVSHRSANSPQPTAAMRQVQQQQERAAAKNALAALKGIERRENVSNYAEQGGKILALQPEYPRYASNTAEPSFTATNALSISTSMTQIANFLPYTR